MTTVVDRMKKMITQNRQKYADEYFAILKKGDKASDKDLAALSDLIKKMELSQEQAAHHEAIVRELTKCEALAAEIPARQQAFNDVAAAKEVRIKKAQEELDAAKKKFQSEYDNAWQEFRLTGGAHAEAHSAKKRAEEINEELAEFRNGWERGHLRSLRTREKMEDARRYRIQDDSTNRAAQRGKIQVPGF